MSSKSTLRGFFATGLRPTQLQFEDLINSSINHEELNPTTTFEGGLVIGSIAVPDVPGAIRWTGTRFEFRDNVGFQPLGGGIGNPTDIGNVRIGSIGVNAVFANSTKFTIENMAFAQSNAGATTINSPSVILFKNSVGLVSSTVMSISGSNVAVLTIASNVATVNTSLVVGTVAGAAPPVGPLPNSLLVYGEARKSDGLASWTIMSDVRLKEDVRLFSEGLDKIMQINPVWFKYKNSHAAEEPVPEQVGILAHELQPVFPYMIKAVKGKIDVEDKVEADLLSFNASALQFVMVNAIKELGNRVKQLEKSLIKA